MGMGTSDRGAAVMLPSHQCDKDLPYNGRSEEGRAAEAAAVEAHVHRALVSANPLLLTTLKAQP